MFSKIVNIAFLKYAKEAHEGVLFFPAINKQQGRVNYIIVCQGPYTGVYKWDPDIIPTLRRWFNKKTECFVLPMDKTIKIKELADIDERLPLGRYILKVIRKVNEEK